MATSVTPVSVLMPVHNGGHYLALAIESILCQSFEDFDFLIIDDGSSDDSLEIALSYDDHRIRVIVNPQNLGLTKSLNAGMRTAQGKLIARQDADDVSLPGRLLEQFQALSEQPEAVLATSYCELIDDMGCVFGHVLPKPDRERLYDQFAAGDSPFPHGSVMFRRDAVLAIDGYDERFWYAQDFDLWVRLLATRGREITVIRQPLYQLRKVVPDSPVKAMCQSRYAGLAWEQCLRGEHVDFEDVVTSVRQEWAQSDAVGEFWVAEHWLSLALTALRSGRRSLCRRYVRRAIDAGSLTVKARALWRLLLSALPRRLAGMLQRRLRSMIGSGPL